MVAWLSENEGPEPRGPVWFRVLLYCRKPESEIVAERRTEGRAGGRRRLSWPVEDRAFHEGPTMTHQQARTSVLGRRILSLFHSLDSQPRFGFFVFWFWAPRTRFRSGVAMRGTVRDSEREVHSDRGEMLVTKYRRGLEGGRVPRKGFVHEHLKNRKTGSTLELHSRQTSSGGDCWGLVVNAAETGDQQYTRMTQHLEDRRRRKTYSCSACMHERGSLFQHHLGLCTGSRFGYVPTPHPFTSLYFS